MSKIQAMAKDVFSPGSHPANFFPGPHDACWDLAAFASELALSPGQEGLLVSYYRSCSGDHDVERRLPFYRAAYLAFRLGYANLAAQTLRGTADAARFADLSRAYTARLRAALAAPARPSTPVLRRPPRADRLPAWVAAWVTAWLRASAARPPRSGCHSGPESAWSWPT